MKIQPLLRYVLVEPIIEEMTKSGLYIPNPLENRKTGDAGYFKGKVLAIGQGIRQPDGNFSPLVVKKGDIILFWKYNPINIDEKDYFIVYEESVIAILKNDK